MLWVLLDDPSSSLFAKVLQCFMMLVILLSIIAFTIASTPSEAWYSDVWANITTGELIVGSNTSNRPPGTFYYDSPRLLLTEVDENRTPFREIETFCIMVFTAEYVLRLLASPAGPGILHYIFNLANIIDLISIMPWYIEIAASGSGLDVLSVLRLIRLTRITRIFKMSKNFQGLLVLFTTLRKSAAALLMLFAFMAIFSILFATLIFTFEGAVEYDEHRMQYVRPDGSASPFESIPHSVWWTIVTMTTVGYGDQVPVTDAGKFVAIVTMFCGLVVLSLPITIIGANFDEEYRIVKKEKQDQQEQQSQLHRTSTSSVFSKGLTTPSKASDSIKEGETRRGDAAAGRGSARVSGAAEDPIKAIQMLIHESHLKLTEEVEEVLVRYENNLRSEIKDVLRRHASGIDKRSTPLDTRVTPGRR